MTTTLPQQSVQDGSETDFDALLHASRRVDWRFLLPDPHLGAVAHVGPADGTLIESLHQFSDSLTVLRTSDSRNLEDSGNLADVEVRDAQFDVVVASGPNPELLEQAARLVQPGGFLYVEAARKRLGGWGSPAQYVAALERLGFRDVLAHWHWPSFNACTEILPLGDKAALMHLFSRRGNGLKSRCRAALGRCLLASGLLVHFVRCFSVVARRPVVRSHELGVRS